MRLWSLHPKYLDSSGLVACWREGIGAQSCLLRGEYAYVTYFDNKAGGHLIKKRKTGYYNHPQLDRFKQTRNPLGYIGYYLWEIWAESNRREFNFNLDKIEEPFIVTGDLAVTSEQLMYEFRHLQDKLYTRDNDKFAENTELVLSEDRIDFDVKKIEPNPLFKVIEGGVESWEVVK